MAKRRPQSSRWLQRQRKDPYVKKAQASHYRARSAFKLLQIQQRYQILRSGMQVADLGAAPGGWSQVAAEHVGSSGRVFALDRLAIKPVAEHVHVVQGDFTEAAIQQLVYEWAGGGLDVVLSDLSPNISGVRVVDDARSLHLCELTHDFARSQLKLGGSLVIKLFQGAGVDEYIRKVRPDFTELRIRKPDASRKESREVYLVGMGFKQGR